MLHILQSMLPRSKERCKNVHIDKFLKLLCHKVRFTDVYVTSFQISGSSSVNFRIFPCGLCVTCCAITFLASQQKMPHGAPPPFDSFLPTRKYLCVRMKDNTNPRDVWKRSKAYAHRAHTYPDPRQVVHTCDARCPEPRGWGGSPFWGERSWRRWKSRAVSDDWLTWNCN